MADTKETKVHGHDTHGKDDPARLRPYEFNKPRTQAEIVAEAYDHETPTPTQEENDAAKLAAMHQDPGSLDPQSAEAKRKREQDAQTKQQEANKPAGGYATRSTPAAS